MGENKGQTIFLSVIGIATLLVAIIGATFAYFTTTVEGNNVRSASEFTTLTVGKVAFNAGTIATPETDIVPGWSDSAKVDIMWTPTDIDISYKCSIVRTDDNSTLSDVYVSSVANNEAGYDALTTAGTSSLKNHVKLVKDQPVVLVEETIEGNGNSGSNNKAGSVSGKRGIVYTVSFKETGTQQNTPNEASTEQSGKTFTSTIQCETTGNTNAIYSTSGNTPISTVASTPSSQW